MNFDELKKQWDNQSPEEIKVCVDLEKVQMVNTVIERVQKTWRKIFFQQVIGFCVLFIMPFVLKNINHWIVLLLLFFYAAILAFPSRIIFLFYKESYKMEFNSLRNINWFYYNYKFSIEMFKIYNYISYVIVIISIVLYYLLNVSFMNKIDLKSILFLLGMFSLILVVNLFKVNSSIKRNHEEPLSQLKEVLDELEP